MSSIALGYDVDTNFFLRQRYIIITVHRVAVYDLIWSQPIVIQFKRFNAVYVHVLVLRRSNLVELYRKRECNYCLFSMGIALIGIKYRNGIAHVCMMCKRFTVNPLCCSIYFRYIRESEQFSLVSDSIEPFFILQPLYKI